VKDHRRVLFLFLAVLTLSFVFLLNVDRIVFVVGDWVSRPALERTREDISLRLQYLLAQSEEIAKSAAIISALDAHDAFALLAASTEESRKCSVEGISLADADGFILTRTRTPTKNADNVFLTSFLPRETAAGRSASAASGMVRSGTVSLAAAAPVEASDGTFLGSVFLSDLMNAEYARSWRDLHLAAGEEIAFYAHDVGIVGSSFSSESANNLLSVYFSPPEHAAIDDGSLRTPVNIDGRHYIARAVPLANFAGEDIGAVILFVPLQPIIVATSAAMFVTCFFLILNTLSRGKKRRAGHADRDPYYVSTLSLALFFLTFFTMYFAILRSTVALEEPPYALYNSTISLDPESAVYKLNEEQTIAVNVHSGGEAINAVSAVIQYDPLLVRVEDIITDHSLCASGFLVEKNNDETNGVVTVTCVVPNPGFSKSKSTLAELVVRPLASGEFTLHFSDQTQVLANDGLGTSVLRLSTGGSYQVIGASPGEGISQGTIGLYSLSHPNTTRWYNNKFVSAFWTARPGYSYQYALNREMNVIPADVAYSTANEATFIAHEDGIHYIHLRETKDGIETAAAHYRVLIDTTPPPLPTILASKTEVKPGEVVLFDFENTDSSESLQLGFYVRLNGRIFFPVKPPFYAPFFKEGDYPITVRVFDKAGNTSENSIVIHVRK